MKKALWIYLFLFFAVPGFSQEIDRSEMLEVAKGFFQEHSTRKSYSSEDIQWKDFSRGDTTLMYLAHNQKDFVLFANDMRVDPILGYSLEGTFQGEEFPPQLEDLLKGYSDQILLLKRKPVQKASTNFAGTWEDYLKGDFNKMSAQVEPIIDVNWNQGRGWNRYCPEDADGPGGHAYVGCVAVAMGQAMSVYEHPDRGEDSSSYRHSEYGEISANYEETQYKWNLMSATAADDYNSLLLYHLAVSVEMDFAPDGSGAYTKDAASALKKYFDYSNDLYYASSTDDQVWTGLLKSELDAGRPIIYGGNNGSDVGHAFNLDGYADNDYFHVNWGWSGQYNGYFTLSSLTPYSGADYSKNGKAVLNIKPMDHAPVDIELSQNTLVDTIDAGTVVAVMSTIDPDRRDSFTYQVRGALGVFGRLYCPFATREDSLVLSEKVSHEDYQELKINIVSEDSQGNLIDKDFTIEVLKGNYPPTDLTLSNTALYDTMSIGSFVGRFSTRDPDKADHFTYELVESADSESDQDNGKFLIVRDSLLTDFDFSDFSASRCSIYVKTTDSHSESLSKPFVLEVNKVQTDLANSNFNDEGMEHSRVFPNPTAGYLYISSGDALVRAIRLYDSNGNLLRSLSGEIHDKELDLSGMSPGVYLVRLEFQSGGKASYKIVLQ